MPISSLLVSVSALQLLIVMQAGDKKTAPYPDDIDLLLLVERSIRFFKTYKWLFVFAIAAGIAIGTYFYMAAPKVYKARLLLHSAILSNPEEIEIIQTWNQLLKTKQYKALSESFQCSEELLGCVRDLKANEIEKIFVPNNPNGFILEATVTDNSIWKDLEKGIVRGLSTTDYAREKIAVKKANLTELIDKTTKEIQRFDSTKQKIREILDGQAKASSALVIDGAGIHRQTIDLNEKLLNYKQDLRFSDAVQVLQSFSLSQQPVRTSRFVWLFIGIVGCLCLAYVYALFSSINKKLKMRSRNLTISR